MYLSIYEYKSGLYGDRASAHAQIHTHSCTPMLPPM